ncbi:membrane protein FxsA [candidate division KSB1 bacterium]|nr:membrane protein FxsA [candidate division KSB1 bacterium]
MFIRLIALFTIVPLVELMLLIELGQRIGLWDTILVVIITGVVGAALARSQGFRIVTQIQRELANGQLPGESLIDGAFVLAGGLLLLTPGLVTDAMGFIFLLPYTRTILKTRAIKYFRSKIDTGEIHVNYKIEN